MRTDRDEGILFEDMPPARWEKMKEGYNSRIPKSPYPGYIPGQYYSLADELRAKCNPANFMSPYDYEKVKAATRLYSAIEACGQDRERLRQLRKQATKELGIRPSTERLYKELAQRLNPARFVGDAEKTFLANELYRQVLLHADNVEELEKIEGKLHAEAPCLFPPATGTSQEEEEGIMRYAPIATIIMLTIFFILLYIIYIMANWP